MNKFDIPDDGKIFIRILGGGLFFSLPGEISLGELQDTIAIVEMVLKLLEMKLHRLTRE